MSAAAVLDPDPLLGVEDRVVINEPPAVLRHGEGDLAHTAPLFGFQPSARSVDGQTISLPRSGEIGGVVKENSVLVAHIRHIGVLNVDLGIKDAHVGRVNRPRVKSAGALQIEGIQMVVLHMLTLGAGLPSGQIGAVSPFLTGGTVPSVFPGGVELAVGSVVIQGSEGVDRVGDPVDPPVDQVEVVAGLMDGKAAGVLAHPVPTVEIAGAVFDVDVPGEVHMGDPSNALFQQQFPQFPVDRGVAVIEGADDFPFGLLFGLTDPDHILDIGAHGLFADDIEIVLQPLEDVVHMKTVFAHDKEGVRFGLFDHFFHLIGPILRKILGFGDLFLADFEAQRVDIQKADHLGGIREIFDDRLDKHSDGSS